MDGKLRSLHEEPHALPTGMPLEHPLDMPTQDLRAAADVPAMGPVRARVLLGRALTLVGTLAITIYAVHEMLVIVDFARMTMLQGVMILFFTITLSWIAFAAASAMTGLMIPPPRHRQDATPGSTLTALLMPIYNEDPARTTAALRAMAEALQQQAAARYFEIVIASDSTAADAWISESLAVDDLRNQLRDIMPVWYRRRWRNTGRKAGNIEEFVKRWGGRYDYMVVLDADSLMSADTLVELVCRMQLDERLGILQTVPMLTGHASLFARVQQFSSRVYGGLIARGMAAWSGDEGNYWGHNAIIRVAAFAQACGLPQLPGRRPFGGHILSHDFVEAALMRRAGWKVCMAPDLEGSWEEGPPSLVDVAVRDRRWAQGNLQHGKVIGATGLTFTHRSHFFIGIMSYLSSPLWLLLLLVGFALTLQAALIRPEYFSREFQLFPDWPRFDAVRMTRLFVFTMIILFTPKILGLVRAMFTPTVRRGCGGFLAVTFGTLVESLIAALYAPIMMLVQSRHVIEILTGRDSGWQSQRRQALRTAWGDAWSVHWPHFAIGVLVSVVAYLVSPTLAAWLSPTLLGLLLAVPLAKISGSVRAGSLLARFGLLRTPEENDPPAIIRRRDELLEQGRRTNDVQGGDRNNDRHSMPDGLRHLACNQQARLAHIAGNMPRPAEVRGHPDAHRLTAERKVLDAKTLDEALAWLGPAERVHVAADPRLLERLAELAQH